MFSSGWNAIDCGAAELYRDTHTMTKKALTQLKQATRRANDAITFRQALS
ncbi:hypothetical protein ADILRU_1625 [Leifsonia rubra CMS 76R]|nr:hypothetical protein ADILRU_1625 [Leifsonia rubra CMS 76R]